MPIQLFHLKIWISVLFNLTNLKWDNLKLKIKDYLNLISQSLIMIIKSLENNYLKLYKNKDNQNFKQQIILLMY